MRTWSKRLVSVGVLAALFTPVASAVEVAVSEDTSQAQADVYRQSKWVYSGTYAPGTGDGRFRCAITRYCSSWKWVYNGRGSYDLYLLIAVPVRV